MTDLPSLPRARLFTAFGTVLYVDVESGTLRHGAVESSPTNVAFLAEPASLGPLRRGRLIYDSGQGQEPVLCLPDYCGAASDISRKNTAAAGGLLQLIPLERGLLALEVAGRFLSAEPNGGTTCATSVCSTWELFLASEDWCARSAATANGEMPEITGAIFDRKRIQSYIVHPVIRARASANPPAAKVLIYGYPQWSHGRVYYDLCRQLYRRGYIVDIMNWQINHIEYIDRLLMYYDFFMTAPDGASTLADSYRVPYEKMILISHHEFDLRMLTEQKGIDVFDKFASYGVVSYYVYCASLMQGVRRPAMVASLGIDFAEFYSEVPERLETVGYASSMSVTTYGVEWKRGYLAEAAAREAGLAFKVAGSTGNQMSFHDMPDFYRTVDAILTSSISEAAQLPVMEAAAAGRLVIGTPVGHFPVKAYQGGGIIAPIEADKFTAFVAAALRHYKEHPAEYVAKCRAIQEAARQFDWRYSIREWIDLIEAAKSRHLLCRSAIPERDSVWLTNTAGDCRVDG